MDIWLIRDGEKAGPFHDYEIRRRIGLGELEATSPAWHEGLPAWTTLAEIPLFQGEFDREKASRDPVIPPPIPPPLPSAPPVKPENPRIIRRFCARWFDLYFYAALWWFLMWLSGRNIEWLLTSTVVTLTRLIPWFVIEILLIHRFGTTPGKWLLGLRVANQDGSLLTLGQSTRRALRVFFIGIGFVIPLVTLFCMALSAYTARRIGAPIWDHVGKHAVTAKPLAAWKMMVFAILFFSAFLFQFCLVWPVMMKITAKELNTEEQKPLREYFQKDQWWALPRRDQ